MSFVQEGRRAWVFVVSEQKWDTIWGVIVHGVPEGFKDRLIDKGGRSQSRTSSRLVKGKRDGLWCGSLLRIL